MTTGGMVADGEPEVRMSEMKCCEIEELILILIKVIGAGWACDHILSDAGLLAQDIMW